MSYPTTTYTPSKVFLYNQYKENVALQKFVDALNSYIQDMLSEVFEVLKSSLDIRAPETIRSTAYKSFYLSNYFGLKKIPDPGVHRNLASVVWDEVDVEYDEANPIRYDELLSDDSEGPISSYLPDAVWASLCKYKLDYNYELTNLDSVRRLLELFYEGFSGGDKLDFKSSIKLTPIVDLQRRRLIVKIKREPIWEAFRLLVLYSPELIGLPYGSSLEVDFVEEEREPDENA